MMKLKNGSSRVAGVAVVVPNSNPADGFSPHTSCPNENTGGWGPASRNSSCSFVLFLFQVFFIFYSLTSVTGIKFSFNAPPRSQAAVDSG